MGIYWSFVFLSISSVALIVLYGYGQCMVKELSGGQVVLALSDFLRAFLPRPDIPKATARFGSSLNAHIIKEGDDVYFECSIKANPRATVVSWSHNVS